MATIPKTIINHPGVLCCRPAYGCLCVEEGGPRYDVILLEGWCFTAGDFAGYDEPRRHGFFRTVAEFIAAKPKYVGMNDK